MKRVMALLFSLGVFIVASAHVGSPNVVFDGSAGPYAVRVIVRPPAVVPGLAEVIVRVDAPDVKSVLLRPVFWRAGVSGAPGGDNASRVAGQDRVYTGQLWLMSRGSYSVYVTVSGARGAGTVIVPVNAFATGRLALPGWLAAILALLATALVAGLLTIVRAAAGESLLAPGQALSVARRRRANRVTIVAAPIIAVVLFGGATWWNAVDANYQRTMFRPPAAVAGFTIAAGHRTLELKVADTASFRAIFSPVVPDHGKMMHLFLVGMPDMTEFAHLHPAETDSLRFTGEIPWLPAGRYHLFGDITLENGTSLTVSNVVDLPGADGAVVPSDNDDSWARITSATPIAAGASASIGDGYRMEWTGIDAPVRAGRSVDLRFSVLDGAGHTASLHPFLGMAAHAAVMKDDGSVFIHLHPMGTVSTTAQEVFKLRDAGDTTANGRLRTSELTAGTMPGMSMSGDLMIPYEFPKPGRYRIWVQAKPHDRVLTGVFDLDVR